MNGRIYRSDKRTLLEEGRRIIASSADAGFIRKVTLVSLMLNGMSPTELSAACAETARTLSSWVKTVDESGFEALRSKKRPGRPSRLTAEQKAEIKTVLTDAPEVFAHDAKGGPGLSAYIEKTYGIRIGIRQCQRLLHELKFPQNGS